MWHEIRKQERKIRCMIVDYKRRAERRRDYYEKIKADPTQFLQIHGRACKIHLDPQIAAAGDSPAVMMNWQGGQDVVIDRFDVRAHLDVIAEYRGSPEEKLSYDERLINYERYRILVQNDFLGVTEEKFLNQIYLEEQFGAVKNEPQPLEGKKKVAGAAIGYNYEDPTADITQQPPPLPPEPEPDPPAAEDEEEDDSDIDFDMCVDVNKVSTQQAHELNSCGHIYGMDGNDFFSFLTKDKEEADNLRIAKELEEEKAMYSGRKSRRERRAYRDKKLAGRKISPPSYASRKSPTYRDYCDLSRSRSKSNSPVNSGKITYITSFSCEEAPGTSPKPTKTSTHKSSGEEYHRVVKYRSRTPDTRRHRHRTRSRSRSPDRIHRDRDRRKTRSRSRSRSTSSRTRHRRRSRSISKSYKSSSQREPKSSKSKSKSPTRVVKMEVPKPVFNPAVPVKQPAPPIISRYYGRRGGSSSSELSLSEDEDQDGKGSNKSSSQKKPWSDFGNASGRNKTSGPGASTSGPPKLTPQERLKKKMQALLNKQYKADKKAEREKKEKEEQERLDREDEMREMSIKLRKRERRRRHEHLSDRRRSGSSQSGSTNSRSRSRSWSPVHSRHRRRRRSYSRSRSRSRSRERVEGPRPLVDY